MLGVVTILFYAVHARTPWPSGYELTLAILFYIVILSGLFGYVLQRSTPGALANIGYEIIWERIPAEIYAGALSVTVDAQEIVVIGDVERLGLFLEEASQVHQRPPLDWMR